MVNKKRSAPTKSTTEQVAGKMKLNPGSVKDLTPSARAGGHIKGGIPRLTNSGGGGTGTGGGS